LRRRDFPVTVTIKTLGGGVNGGIIALRGYVDSNGNPQFDITNVIKTIQDANGTIIPLKPITSKVLVAQCHNRWYIFGGTGRWFYKEDDLEAQEPFINNFIFGIPVTCGSTGCTLSAVENVTANENGTTNPNLGWYITLAPGNSTEELLREKDVSDPKILTRTNVVLFSTIRPSYAYCSVSEGYTNFWAMDCASGGTISAQQAQGNIVTQLSTSQVVKISLQQFVSKRVIRNYFGVASQSPVQVILPTPVNSKGRLILWLEY
jgi:type IV pilus assembly protein PilY1